jgi:hypothetical protein
MSFVVAIAFVAASSLISSEPVASSRLLSQAPQIGSYFARPIVPAMLVALHDIHTEYRTLKGGQMALVITGTAQNVGARPLHLVQIDADLLEAGGAHPLARLPGIESAEIFRDGTFGRGAVPDGVHQSAGARRQYQAFGVEGGRCR